MQHCQHALVPGTEKPNSEVTRVPGAFTYSNFSPSCQFYLFINLFHLQQMNYKLTSFSSGEENSHGEQKRIGCNS